MLKRRIATVAVGLLTVCGSVAASTAPSSAQPRTNAASSSASSPVRSTTTTQPFLLSTTPMSNLQTQRASFASVVNTCDKNLTASPHPVADLNLPDHYTSTRSRDTDNALATALNAASWQHMLTTPDPVASFDQLITDIQMIDAYDAFRIQVAPGAMPFDAIFALTSEVPTIFPNNPADLVAPGEQGPSAWGVSLVEQEATTGLTNRGSITWDTFLSQLPENSRQPIGDGHFLVTVPPDLMRELSVGSHGGDDAG